MSEEFNMEEWLATDHSGLQPREMYDEIVRGTVETLGQFKAVAAEMIDKMIEALNDEDIVMANGMAEEFHMRADLINHIIDIANRGIIQRRRIDNTAK